MDKFTALTVFRRVAELESFTAAARDLRLSNAAVSKNVRELELELGASLLHRTTRQVHLTPAGEAYYRRTSALLDELRDADAAVKELNVAPRGLLRVSAPLSLGLSRVMPLVSTFLNAYPEIQLELELNDRYVDLVEEGFDVALRGGGPLPDSSLVARRVFEIERVLCAAPAYLTQHAAPATPSELGAHRCLAYSLARAPDCWTFTKDGETCAVPIQGPLRVNNSLALVQAAVAGVGIAFVPRVLIDAELASGALQPLLTDWRGELQALYALYPRHRQTSNKVRLFVEFLLEHSGRGSRAEP